MAPLQPLLAPLIGVGDERDLLYVSDVANSEASSIGEVVTEAVGLCVTLLSVYWSVRSEKKKIRSLAK